MTAKTDRFRWALLALLVTAILFRLIGILSTAGDTELTVWGDRDLWRALAVADHWPLFGPESNGGSRPPGGAFYLLLAGILAIQTSVTAAHLGVIVLFAMATALMGLFFARDVSPLAGALVATIFAGSGLLSQILAVWNPGFIVFFAVVATLAGYLFLKTGRATPLAFAAAAIGFGLQIHMQMFQVAAGLVIATLVLRPRLGWRHALATGGGLLLPFLPSVAAGGLSLFGLAGALPGDAVTNYVFGEFDPATKAQLIYELMGGDSSPFAIAAGARPGLKDITMAAADALAACLVALFIVMMAKSRHSAALRRPFVLFPLIVLVSVAVCLVSAVNIRHVVAGVPAAAAMAGLAATWLLDRFTKRSRPVVAAALGAACVGLLGIRLIGLNHLVGGDAVANPRGTLAQSEIAATVKPRFYADHQAFEEHAALFLRAGKRWKLAEEGVGGQMSFLYRTLQTPTPSSDQAGCLAIVTKTGGEGDPRAQLAAAPAFAGLDPLFGDVTAESAHFLYLPYRTSTGNCLKSFPNAYIPADLEARYLPAGAPSGAGRTADGVLFVAPLPGRTFPLGVEIRRMDQDYQAVLHGRPLRGYTGLYFQTIEAPVLCLVGDNGVTIRSFGKGTIGSSQRGTLAPWRSLPFSLPTGGYRLWLIGRDGLRQAALKLPLGRLSFPDLDIAPPAVAEDMSPPAGCPDPLASQP